MPELRIDSLTGLRTIVADERAGRPGGALRAFTRDPIDPESDPFLGGHEDRTPPELYVLPGEDGRWRVRVVPNLYPALTAVDESTAELGDPLASGRGEPDLFSARPAHGAHEVIINSPEAFTSLADLEDDQVESALGVWRTRMRVHASSSYVHVIVNEGPEAGASLPHTHAQLYALPFVPAAVARERERFTAYADRTHGRNLLEDVLGEEVRLRQRIVALDHEAVAICPFASRLPFQVQIIPRRPRARFEEDGPLAAALLREVLLRLGRVLGAVPPLNLWVRTAPSGAEHYCWRIDLLPRLGQLAGLELGTGLNLNVLAPERAAGLLRDA